MCTYQTVKLDLVGSGKGTAAWIPVTEASVYFDHPVHAQAGHTLNIDLRNPGRGPGARVALELTAASALDLAHAILAALAEVPADLLAEELPAERLAELTGVAGLLTGTSRV
jgi:hypothetical protein